MSKVVAVQIALYLRSLFFRIEDNDMTRMSSISKLTTSVDQLTGEANITKAQLDARVA